MITALSLLDLPGMSSLLGMVNPVVSLAPVALSGVLTDSPAEAPPTPVPTEAVAEQDPEPAPSELEMSPEEIDALVAKINSGATLSAQEQAKVEALKAAAAAEFDATLTFQTGDIDISHGLATLHLGEDFRYISPSDAEKVLVEAWGNMPSEEPTLGMILPKDVSPAAEAGWGVIVTYVQEGHVKDDDADDIDYDELLEQMQEATEANNEERTKQGFPSMHLVGWAEPPRYDENIHSLYWAQELAIEGGGENSLNYAIRALGRKGVLELNAVAAMSAIDHVKPEMEKIFATVEFNDGNRYEDFDPDLDKVAAYGLGGLVAGKLAMKAGLFAGLIKVLIAAKKFVIIGLVAAGAFIARLLGRRKEDEE